MDDQSTAENVETITLTPDDGLTVKDMLTLVGWNQILVFKAEEVSARVYMPERFFDPQDQDTTDAVNKLTKEGDDYLLFDIAAGETLSFRPREELVDLHYVVTRTYAEGNSTSIKRAPVIIIVKINNS
jgi:hypothetical protein